MVKELLGFSLGESVYGYEDEYACDFGMLLTLKVVARLISQG